MAVVPFELRYELTRRQRLVPHLRIWGHLALVVPAGLAGLLAGAGLSCWLAAVAIGWAWLFRNFFVGLLDVLLRPVVVMDVRVEENGLGVLVGGERWWLFLDGLTGIEQRTAGVWTLEHWNGCVVHIPAAAITAEQLDHLRQAMARGRTPEGIRAVIERGRLLERLQGERGRDD